MDELQQLFRDALPAGIAALEHAARSGDEQAVRRNAHMLRGSGGTYGFPAISEAAQAVEHATAAELDLRLAELLALLRRTLAGGRAPAANVKSGRSRDDRMSTAHVMIVDDDAGIRFLATFVLEKHGFAVSAFPDATSAAEAVIAAPPDVLLMDVVLGDDDGVAVGERLVARCAVPPRLIFLTAAAGEEARRRMRAAGAAAIVAKPFDPETLPSLVADHVVRT